MRMLGQLRQWRWLIVLLLFCACVTLKLNGSSVGMWDQELSGRKASKGLLLFEPQPIRTDEWLVWTPAALSQARQIPRFPIENPNLGAGRAPLLLNLPVAYYTTWFRPQLWGFFILDFERGFSFCWMAKIFAVVLAGVVSSPARGPQSRPRFIRRTLDFSLLAVVAIVAGHAARNDRDLGNMHGLRDPILYTNQQLASRDRLHRIRVLRR